MPEMHGDLPLTQAILLECRWCGRLTDLRFAPRGSRVGPVPLHFMCSGSFLLAYDRWRYGLKLKPSDQERLLRLGVGAEDV